MDENESVERVEEGGGEPTPADETPRAEGAAEGGFVAEDHPQPDENEPFGNSDSEQTHDENEKAHETAASGVADDAPRSSAGGFTHDGDA